MGPVGENAPIPAPDDLARELERSGYGAEGFADRYDAVRPRPPAALVELLAAVAGGRPALVVDLGAGTGLSTRAWSGHADDVVGVEPNDAMRLRAAAATDAPNVRYAGGSSYATGVDEAAADVVTCSQSFQWMEPTATLAEVARILRPGGVFCAYEYQSLQTPFWEPERAWARMRETVGRLRQERGLDRDQRRLPPSLARLEKAGCFDDCRELAFHSLEEGDADRLVGFALSEGSATTLLAAGATEHEIGLTRLREVAATHIGDRPCAWWLGYRAWLGRRAFQIASEGQRRDHSSSRSSQ
jgi:ubiquinone/menaquinone biosynthesis C-methylase UbiE